MNKFIKTKERIRANVQKMIIQYCNIKQRLNKEQTMYMWKTHGAYITDLLTVTLEILKHHTKNQNAYAQYTMQTNLNST